MTCWEDRLNPASCAPEVAANAAAWREQQAMIERVREEVRWQREPFIRSEDGAPWDGARVRRLRAALGLTREAFGALIGVNRHSVKWWELQGFNPGNRDILQSLIELERDGIEGMVAD